MAFPEKVNIMNVKFEVMRVLHCVGWMMDGKAS